MVLKFSGGVQIGDGSDGSGDRGLYSLSCRITALVANQHVDWVVGEVEITEAGWHKWLPNAFGNVGSLESESIVTICGSGEATKEIVVVSLAIAPDSSVELKTTGTLLLIGLLSSDERST